MTLFSILGLLLDVWGGKTAHAQLSSLKKVLYEVLLAYRVAHKLSDTITRTLLFLSDQTVFDLYGSSNTSEGVSLLGHTTPVSTKESLHHGCVKITRHLNHCQSTMDSLATYSDRKWSNFTLLICISRKKDFSQLVSQLIPFHHQHKIDINDCACNINDFTDTSEL